MPNHPMDVQVVTRGVRTGPAVKAYARRKVAALARRAPGSVRYARVTLGHAADPAVARPAHAEAILDLNGRPVRAEVSARRLEEAVDLLEARLRHRLEQLASRRRTLHRSSGLAEPGEWRHGDLPPRRPAGRSHPPGDRQVLRHTTFSRQPVSIEEAAGELALLDYDFHLFTEAGTGQDAVLWRRPAGALWLSLAGPRAPELADCAVPVEAQPPPTARTERQAIELLDLTGARFVFFVDTGTDRGTVVYRRLDGRYGLLRPGAAP
jgi:ribosome-associated translation inhibitor RaiA